MSIVPTSALACIETKRSGVIPYTRDPFTGHLFFLLARHRASGELGDLGGGVKKNERALSAAFREFAEESGSIFPEYRAPNDLCGGKIAVVDRDNMAIVFAPVKFQFVQSTRSLFDEATANEPKIRQEVSELVWVTEEEFRTMILYTGYRDDLVMWKRIRTFFQRTKTVDISETLRSIPITVT